MLFTLLLIIHVISVVLWIGGVAFVTMVMFPIIMRTAGSIEKAIMFQGVEHRFARLAKIYSITAGITGLFLLYRMGMSFLLTGRGIGIWVMIVAWTTYVLILFIFEPIIFKTLFSKDMDASRVFFRLQVFHWFLLILSLIAVGAGIWTGHGP